MFLVAKASKEQRIVVVWIALLFDGEEYTSVQVWGQGVDFS